MGINTITKSFLFRPLKLPLIIHFHLFEFAHAFSCFTQTAGNKALIGSLRSIMFTSKYMRCLKHVYVSTSPALALKDLETQH